MPRLPPPLSVTVLPPLMVSLVTRFPPCQPSLQLCVLHTTSVFFTTIVTGLDPQLNETFPPDFTALASLAYVQDFAVPLPITFFLTFADFTAAGSTVAVRAVEVAVPDGLACA